VKEPPDGDGAGGRGLPVVSTRSRRVAAVRAAGRGPETLKGDASNLPDIVDDDEKSIEEILDTIGDQHARRVLAAISREPRSAKELAEECDLSLPTVYRRIEMLEEYDLIEDRTLIADDGNHYKEYESNFESTVISLHDDEYQVRIYREENLPDRFSQLWDELNPE
jgi:DNA-binding transcriptional ArsR family regulator